VIGHKIIGTGDENVLVMHGWFSDSSSYDNLLPYLATDRFTYLFVDFRGYGKSIKMEGRYTLNEIVEDIYELIQELEWERFHIVAHSMSGLVAERMAVDILDCIKSIVAISPVPACGTPLPEDVLTILEEAATSNDEEGEQVINFMTSNRYTHSFSQYKVKQWRDTSTAEARIAYLHMFDETNFEEEVEGIDIPYLIIIGEHDAEAYSAEAMERTWLKWHPNATLTICENASHYSMQETPVYLTTLMEGFFIKSLT